MAASVKNIKPGACSGFITRRGENLREKNIAAIFSSANIGQTLVKYLLPIDKIVIRKIAVHLFKIEFIVYKWYILENIGTY